MSLFAARQPIFDRKGQLHGYELLFRSGPENVFAAADIERASELSFGNTLLGFGLETLTAGKLAYVNVTRRALVGELYTLFPPDRTVIELLETVEPDDEVVDACRAAKKAGYRLALDDYVDGAPYEPLLPLVDILKIDFLTTSAEERRALVRRHAARGLRLLAEKVETHEVHREALDLGYGLFQGYFFCRPELMKGQRIPEFKLNYLRFLREIQRPEMSFERLEETIRREVDLSVKLLRYLNSAGFGWRYEVTSIGQAIRLLGERAMRKWASLAAVSALATDKPSQLVVTTMVRAQLCELLGGEVEALRGKADLFLAGMLSAVDAIVDRPLAEVLGELGVSETIRSALLEGTPPVGQVVGLALAYERADWGRVSELARALHVPEDRLPALHEEAVRWAGDVFRVT